MKDKILKMLKLSGREFISGEKISEEFGVTRAAIWKNINTLKEEGYLIESIPRKGYRIISSPDVLTLVEIEEELNTNYIGRNLFYYETIESTNTFAKKMALDQPEGTVVIAEEQSGGIGRMGRDWLSPKGQGIWMSIILKPEVEPMEVSKISLVGAAAVHSGLNKMALKSQIKWPNDILINGKKVAGILTEMSCELNQVNYLVIGIGINVNLEQLPKDLEEKASSLKIETGGVVDRKLLLAHILNHFEELYEEFKTGTIESTVKICKDNSVLLNEEVRIIKGKETRIGKALDINSSGELVVEFKEGIENIFSGEVSLRGLKGYI